MSTGSTNVALSSRPPLQIGVSQRHRFGTPDRQRSAVGQPQREWHERLTVQCIANYLNIHRSATNDSTGRCSADAALPSLYRLVHVSVRPSASMIEMGVRIPGSSVIPAGRNQRCTADDAGFPPAGMTTTGCFKTVRILQKMCTPCRRVCSHILGGLRHSHAGGIRRSAADDGFRHAGMTTTGFSR